MVYRKGDGQKRGPKKKKVSTWAQAIKEAKKGIPKKGTKDYDFVKKIHERLKKQAGKK